MHPSADGHLGCFHVLAVVNSAVKSIGVHVSFCSIVLSGYVAKTVIAGLHGTRTDFLNYTLKYLPVWKVCSDISWV